MSDALTAHVNRTGLHSLEVPDSFETSDDFDVVVENHGESTHVHLHIDDALSAVAAVEAPNHYIEGGSTRRVRVTRTGDGTARGNLKVVTAHGATTRLVDVQVTESVTAKKPVEVGEELTKPQPRAPEGDQSLLAGGEGRALVAVGLAVGALGLVTGVVAQNPLAALAVVALGVGGMVAAVAVHRAV